MLKVMKSTEFFHDDSLCRSFTDGAGAMSLKLILRHDELRINHITKPMVAIAGSRIIVRIRSDVLGVDISILSHSEATT